MFHLRGTVFNKTGDNSTWKPLKNIDDYSKSYYKHSIFKKVFNNILNKQKNDQIENFKLIRTVCTKTTAL